MKRLAWIAAAGMCLASCGCGPEVSWNPDQEQFVRRLKPRKDVYYEYEPIECFLVTVNNTPEPRSLGLQDRGGYLVLHEVTDNDEVLWPRVPVEQDVVGQAVSPGEAVDLRLLDPNGAARLTRPGTWVVSYRYYRETVRRTFVFSTPELRLQCIPQPLNVPAGTPPEVADALEALASAPAHDYISMFPSWTRVSFSEPMERLLAMGDRAAPALMANLDHHRIRPAAIQVLAAMKYRPAVGQLIAMLKMNSGVQDRLILSALATITGHPGGFDFYSRWDTLAGKEDALAAYRAWAAQNR